jgi:hypothetical protein
MINKRVKKIPSGWLRLFISTVMAVYLYVFMEWLFFLTKTSFMSGMNLFQQVNIFLLSAFALAIPGLVVILVLAGLDAIIRRKGPRKVLIGLATLIPALVFASLVFILVDNFTYTLFKFGVVSTTGVWRAGYAFLFIALCVAAYIVLWRGSSFHDSVDRKPSKLQIYFFLPLLLVSSIIVIIRSPGANAGLNVGMPNTGKGGSSLPNIILLSGDGLSATHLSIYGYDRDTTPNLRKLMGNALVAENAFADAGNTGGSLISVLTGKLPTQTRVYYPPDILTGVDSYQHLPGILKRLGYYTVQITDPYYADAYSRNLLNGFDMANNSSENKTVFSVIAQYVGDGGSTYFNFVILQRLTERLQHAFYLNTMVNPYKLVTGPGSGLSAKQQINEMLSIIDNAKGPVFIQVHMLGTHGPRFEPLQGVFSAGEIQDADWMPDFYDDGILDFDNDVNQVFEHLSKTGKLNNTIVVLYSDHGMSWNSTLRIPLLIWFPDGEHAGTIKQNVQLVDIAPTLLDYLGVAQPKWLSGQSLLQNVSQKYIFSPGVATPEKLENGQYVARMIPPFYQIGVVNLIACDKWYSLYLTKPRLRYGDVDGSTASCEKNDIPSPEQAISINLDYLKKSGYDVSKFPQTIPIQLVPNK